jgi:hypothetical protein
MIKENGTEYIDYKYEKEYEKIFKKIRGIKLITRISAVNRKKLRRLAYVLSLARYSQIIISHKHPKTTSAQGFGECCGLCLHNRKFHDGQCQYCSLRDTDSDQYSLGCCKEFRSYFHNRNIHTAQALYDKIEKNFLIEFKK